jgi:hypothetical protein
MISLDVQIDDPGVYIADVNCVSADYFIYPGSISIDAGGYITDWGICAGVLDGNSMTSEQGSLYEDGVDPYPVPGDLFIVTLGGCTLDENGEVDVTVSENALRGGIVMEDPDVGPTAVDVSATATVIMPSGCCADDCGLACATTCMGDMNGDGWLSPTDLSMLFNTLAPVGSPYWLQTTVDDCGDMNQDGWLSPTDLSLLFNTLGPVGAPYWLQCP